MFTPVAFSFGWVAYATSAVVGAVGENKLMAPPDCACIVINADRGYVKQNSSWIIGRLVRDFDWWLRFAKDPDSNASKSGPVSDAFEQVLEAAWLYDESTERKRIAETQNLSAANHGHSASTNGKGRRKKPLAKCKEILAATKEQWKRDASLRLTERPQQAGLCISVFQARDAVRGYAGNDWLYYSGIATGLIQLGVAAVPIGAYRDWGVMVITASGILLSLVTGALPQWRTEKWACRELTKEKTVIFTKGNGSQHAIVIIGAIGTFNLEDLASGPASLDRSASVLTKVSMILLWVLWILLLITASGLDQHTWDLLLNGGLGILQNIFVAGAPRKPEDYGMPLRFKAVFANPKVIEALYAVEKKYPKVGRSLVATFFPAGLDAEEEKKFNEIDSARLTAQQATKAASQSPASQNNSIAQVDPTAADAKAGAVRGSS
ncbi:hypothetical protein KCU83_g3359, partial [Aureobasidium melanogenum]